MAGARSLWRAAGMREEHFGKPVIAIANSFSQFVPGHTHLHEAGQFVKSLIEEQGCFAAEFNTIAICDGIAMGHGGMLYSLPSRELIADSVEYMCNAHMVDALVCISNCDKITPGMLMATMRLNIPTIFVSGGPMEAGRRDEVAYDLIDVMVQSADPDVPDSVIGELERLACPTCGSCSGMFTANSMNCLAEALGMALPGNGTIVATHTRRKRLFTQAARRIVEMTEEYYGGENSSVLPRSIATRAAFENAMALDLAMGGSTNTVLHLLAIAGEADVDFTMADIDTLSGNIPCLCKVAPSSHYHVEDVNRAGGVHAILGELDRKGLLRTDQYRVDGLSLRAALDRYDIRRDSALSEAHMNASCAPGEYGRTRTLASQGRLYENLDLDRENGCIRDIEHAYRPDGGLAVLFGNVASRGGVVKTAGVDDGMFVFEGPARVYQSQESACEGILNGEVQAGEVVVIQYEGPGGGPGMQEMLYPTSYLRSMHLEKQCALITDGRFSGGTSGLSIGHISPEAAAGGEIGIVRNGDRIRIDIPRRSINLHLPEKEISIRMEEKISHGGFFPENRQREVSPALRAYAQQVGSADSGAVRNFVSQPQRRSG